MSELHLRDVTITMPAFVVETMDRFIGSRTVAEGLELINEAMGDDQTPEERLADNRGAFIAAALVRAGFISATDMLRRALDVTKEVHDE